VLSHLANADVVSGLRSIGQFRMSTQNGGHFGHGESVLSTKVLYVLPAI
jgi:hypothetical protein